MKTTVVPIGQVKINPSNPRVIKDAKFKSLVESIQKFPKMLHIRPIVVNEDMVVLGGNMRLRACQEAGIKNIPILKADELTPEEQKEFIIKDNIGFGEWDWDVIANEWNLEQVKEWGLDVPNFDPFGEIEAKGRMAATLEEKYDTFMNGLIKQIVLYYEFDEYTDVLAKLKAICEENKFEDNSIAVKYLIENYNKK